MKWGVCMAGFLNLDWILLMIYLLLTVSAIIIFWEKRNYSNFHKTSLSILIVLLLIISAGFSVYLNKMIQNKNKMEMYFISTEYSNNQYTPFEKWVKKLLKGKDKRTKPAETPTPAAQPNETATPITEPSVTPGASVLTPQPTVTDTASPITTVPIVFTTAAPTISATPAVGAEGLVTTSFEDINGVQTTIVKANDKVFLDAVSKATSGGEIIIPVQGNTPAVTAVLSGSIVKSMEDKNLTLIVKTADVNYVLPAKEIRIEDVSKNSGKALADIEIKANIAKSSGSAIKEVEDSAVKGNFSVIASPVDFNVQAVSGDTLADIEQFENYILREIRIPDEAAPAKITTALIKSTDGSLRHIPTFITVINGKYYARINSLTNSTYVLIWNPKEFADVSGHWAREQINEMFSRKIINGVADNIFEPERSITRAEFAAIAVKAMGLEPKGSNSFKDVAQADWFYGYVGTAYSFGIILGVGDGSFEPLRSITREEAMVLIQRAAKVTGMNIDVTDNEIGSTLSRFTDSLYLSGWAKGAADFNVKESLIQGSNGRIRPKDKITRAETAVIIMRMLQKSNLIDSRVKA